MDKINNINEAISLFAQAKSILKEDYGIGPEQYGAAEPGMEQYQGEQQSQEDENTDMDISQQDERIAQIREIALNGLQDYAHDVDSEPYQFYKKIWLMCDKAVSEKESASSGV